VPRPTRQPEDQLHARAIASGGSGLSLDPDHVHLDHGRDHPDYGVYAGNQAATEHYVGALATELDPRGVTVNAIAPGPINSPFYFAAETEASAQFASRLSVAGRLGEWDEIIPIIPIVAFLCTPDAQWITAQTIRANGGMSA
jgi:3-oxoacyl-[acyl-carrier protein] reductase